jgi:mRNA interferase RelE/StbE
MFAIELSNTAYKFLRSGKLPASDISAGKDRILALAANPKPAGCEKLKGFTFNYYRVRQGNYRIVYEIKDKEVIVVIVYIGHRKDFYERL